MKYVLAVLILVVAGYFALRQLKPKPAPPPPPAAAVEAPPPPPLIDEAEQANIVRSANDQNPSVRWEALTLLDKMKSPQAYPILFEKLRKDPDTELRIKIIRLIEDRPGPEVSRSLIASLGDATLEVRIAALKALDKIGDYATASAILELTKDPEDSVREQALRTLNSLQDKRAAELAAADRKRQEDQRRQAEEAQKKR